MNELRKTIIHVLNQYYTDSTKDEFDLCVDELEEAISKEIRKHNIDFYSVKEVE